MPNETESETTTLRQTADGDYVLHSQPETARLPDAQGSVHEVRVWPEAGYLLAADLTAVLGYRGTEGVTYHCTDDVHWAQHYQTTDGPSRLISDEDVRHIVETTDGKEHMAGLSAETALTDWAVGTEPNTGKTKHRRRRGPSRSRSRRTRKPNKESTVSHNNSTELEDLEAELDETKTRLQRARRLIEHYRSIIDEELV